MFGSSKQGTALIDSAIRSFERIVEQIERGVAHNESKIAANNATIEQLHVESVELRGHAVRGRSVAGKLRDLIG